MFATVWERVEYLISLSAWLWGRGGRRSETVTVIARPPSSQKWKKKWPWWSEVSVFLSWLLSIACFPFNQSKPSLEFNISMPLDFFLLSFCGRRSSNTCANRAAGAVA